MKNLSQRKRPSKESEFIFSDPRRDLEAREFGSLVCETCHFLANADDVLRQAAINADSATELQGIIDAGLLLDAKLRTWSGRASGYYKFTSMEIPDVLAPRTPHPSRSNIPVHFYSSLAMACLWNQYRCMRIFLLECILSCLSRQESCKPGELPLRGINDTSIPAAEEIAELINGIFASVPYLLGEVDQDGNLKVAPQKKPIGGFFLIWPLRMILFHDLMNPEQKTWIMERLTYIRNVLGIHKATEPL